MEQPGNPPVALDTPAGYFEELLHEVAQMHEARDRRSMALAGAVHDLKNPLAVIHGFVNLLLGEKLGALTPRQREALHDIFSCCQRLEDGVSKLLFHSANDARKQPLSFYEYDFNATLRQIRDMWTPAFEQKRIGFHCQPLQQTLRFTYDSPKLQQAISNLLENALKFTPPGGSVSVIATLNFWERRTAAAEVAVERRQRRVDGSNAVKIVVADNGPGIAPEFQQEIFEEFFSASPPGVTPGVGLGLTIARYLVQAHGGKIWVDSRPGQGTEFSIVVPFTPQPPASPGT